MADTDKRVKIVYENSYITEPEGYGSEFVFRRGRVQQVLQAVLAENLQGKNYDPTNGAQLSKQLADDVLQRCKALGCSRHKLAVQVNLLQNIGQSVTVSSRALWDTSSDGWASETYSNDSLICTLQVYGVYFE